MAKYNRALDLLGLALSEQVKGNKVNASAILAMAAKESSAKRAMDVIDATNQRAVEAQNQAGGLSTPAKVVAAPKVTAGSGAFEPTDAETMKLLAQSQEVTASVAPAPVQSTVTQVDAATLKLARALATILDQQAK